MLGLGVTVAVDARAETQAEYIDHLLATWNSFDAEVKNQLAIARLDLDAVREADGWTPDQKEAVRAWLDMLERTGVYTTTETPLGPNRTAVHFRSIAPHNLQSPASQWGDAVTERLRYLENTKRRLVPELAREIFEFADPIWVTARTPADLQPTLAPLSRFKTEVLSKLPDITFNRANAPFPNPSFTSDGARIVLEGEDVRGLAYFVLSPEPLIFPNPEEDPAEYIRLRKIWADIGIWHLHVISASRITNKVYEYDRRLKRAALAARRNLDQLILRSAPPEELSKALADLEVFRIAEPPPPTTSRPLPFATPNPSRPTLSHPRGKTPASLIQDYRDLQKFSPTVSDKGMPDTQELRPVIDEPVINDYRAIIDLLIANVAPMPPDMAPLRKAVAIRMRHLDPRMQAILTPLLQPEPPKTAAPVEQSQPDRADPPMTVLTKRIASVIGTENGAQGADAILSEWEIQEPLMDSRPKEFPAAHDEAWSRLAKSPQGPAIFAARDAASRQLIQQICGEASDAPPTVVLREQVDKAITATNWDRCRRLLAVDQLMTLLPTDEHLEWKAIVNAFESAATATTEKQTDKARMQYRQLLSSTRSAAASEIAARLLKTLPAH